MCVCVFSAYYLRVLCMYFVRARLRVHIRQCVHWKELENEPFSVFGWKSWKAIGVSPVWLEKLELYFWV